MDSLIWKLKQLIRNMLPLAIVGGILYGAYYYNQRGYFRRGVVPGLTRIATNVPVFGSLFRGGHRVGKGKKAYRSPRARRSRGARGRRR